MGPWSGVSRVGGCRAKKKITRLQIALDGFPPPELGYMLKAQEATIKGTSVLSTQNRNIRIQVSENIAVGFVVRPESRSFYERYGPT